MTTALEYLDRIEQTLTVPAAEYVPAIGDAFVLIREARAALASPSSAGAEAQQDAPAAEWERAQAICDLPAVDEAIRNLLEDNTGDNATCLVREVMRAVSGVAAPAGASDERLTKFGNHRNWELSFGSDDEEEPGQWCVHAIHGSRNDREWTLIGQGATPAAAIDAAVGGSAALSGAPAVAVAEPTDTQRLDWLGQHRDLRTDWFMANGERTCILREVWGRPVGSGPTLRAAIDVAMAAHGIGSPSAKEDGNA